MSSPSDPTGGRREARTRATRARFLEAGRKLFAEHGLSGVTSHAIAEEAGYAAGTFYLHFKDKHVLFDELAEEAAQALEARLLAVMAEKTEIADIAYAQADALVSFAEEQRELLLIAFQRSGESSDVGARLLQRLAAGVSSRRRELDATNRRDRHFDPDVLAQAIVGMWAQVLVWWAEDPTRATRDDVIRTMTHLQLFGSRGERIDPGAPSEKNAFNNPKTPDGDAPQ